MKNNKCEKSSFLISAVVGSFIAGIGSPQSSAQQQERSFALEEVTVTAQRREQRLQDIPISASVLSGSMLTENNMQSLEQISQRVPGLTIASAPVSEQIHMRGIGSGLNPGFEQSVGTFVDGIYRGRSRSIRAALFDIERLEVLKGPQTTFFGNNAISGALNITTRRPGDEFAINATTSFVPKTDEYSFEAGIDMPVTDDLSIRLAGRFSGMDGYITNVGGGQDGPDTDGRLGRFSLVWTPTENIETVARVDVSRMRGDGTMNVEIQDCPADPAIFGTALGACTRYINAVGVENVDDKLNRRSAVGPTYEDIDYYEIMQTTTLSLSAHDLVLTTGYYDHDVDTLADTSDAGGYASVVNTTTGIPGRFDEKFDQFSQEIRLQSTGDGKLEYMVGAYYAKAKLDITNYLGFYFVPIADLPPTAGLFPSGTPIAAGVFNEEKSETTSVFGSLTYHFTNRFRTDLGARYTSIDKDAHRLAVVGASDSVTSHEAFQPSVEATPIIAPLVGLAEGNYDDPSRTDEEFMPSVGLQYDFTDELMGYIKYNKGFKAGGYSAFIANSDFEPETVDAFEVGLKGTAIDRRLAYSLAVFYSKYDDMQETINVADDAGRIVSFIDNVAESISKGVEFSLNFQMLENISVYADVSYMDVTYDSYKDAPCTATQVALARPNPCSQDLSGSDRAFAPDWSGSVGVNHTWPLESDLEIRSNLNVAFSSSQYVNAVIDTNLAQPGFSKVDARVAFGPEDRGWEVAVIGRNLNDKDTALYQPYFPGALGPTQALLDPPRTVGIQFSVRY